MINKGIAREKVIFQANKKSLSIYQKTNRTDRLGQ